MSEFLGLIDIKVAQGLFSAEGSLYALRDTSTSFTRFTDQNIILGVVTNKITVMQNLEIVKGEPNVNVQPSKEEIKTFIETTLCHDVIFLSELISQLNQLKIAYPSGKEIDSIKSAVIEKYQESFKKHFCYERVGATGYGYQISLEVGEEPGIQFLFLRNGNRRRDANRLKGWKFHISLDDELSSGKKLNVQLAWNALLACFFSHQVEVVKVVTNETLVDAKCDKLTAVGKQITIYANEFAKDTVRCAAFLKDVTECLVCNNIKPGYRAVGDKAFEGSEFISYRWDTYLREDDLRFGRRREGEPAIPEGVVNPFGDVKVSVPNQPLSKGQKQVEVSKSKGESSEQPIQIPKLNFGSLSKK